MNSGYLMLESPRVPSLGHRTLVSTGGETREHMDDALDRLRQVSPTADRVEAGHAVRQSGQSGVTAREGIERLVFVSPWLRNVEPAVKERVRDVLAELLRKDVGELIADPDLPRMARDRTVVVHPLLNVWRQRVEEVLQGGTYVPGAAPIAPEVLPGQQAPARQQEAEIPHTATTPARPALAPESGHKSIWLRILAGVAIALVIGFVVARRMPGKSTSNNGAAMPSSPGDAKRPETEEEKKNAEERLAECENAVKEIIEGNEKEIEKWAGILDKTNYPFRACLVNVKGMWMQENGAGDFTGRCTRIDKIITEFRVAFSASFPANFLAQQVDNKEFLHCMQQEDSASCLKTIDRELGFLPTNFFQKAYLFYQRKKDYDCTR